MPNKNSSQFQVKLDGIKLPADAEKRIEKGIQALVLQELAAFTPNPDGPDTPGLPHGSHGGGVIVVPIKWPGYWLRLINRDELGNVGKALNVNFQEIGV